MAVNTGLYLTELQHERVQLLARLDDRSVSNYVARLIEEAWAQYVAERVMPPTDQPLEQEPCASVN